MYANFWNRFHVRCAGSLQTSTAWSRPRTADEGVGAVFSMQDHRSLLGQISLMLTMAGVLASTRSAGFSPSGQAKAAATPAHAASFMKHWTADNGNGTYSNPLFYEEFEDPDVIRVGDDYYLAGTTMHMNPAVQIMHSKDLVNWELAGYASTGSTSARPIAWKAGTSTAGASGRPCIRYHDGMFYIFSNVNGAGLQVFRSKSINGPWERNQLPGRHDLSVLFDDDLGKIFIISGDSAPVSDRRAGAGPQIVRPRRPPPTRRPGGTANGRRPSPLQDQRQVLRRLRHPRRNGRSDGRLRRLDRRALDGRTDGPGRIAGRAHGDARARRARTTAASGCIRAAWSIRLGRVVEHHHVRPRQRRPHGRAGPHHLGQRLPAHRPAGQSSQSAEYLGQAQHRCQAGPEAGVRP